MQGIRSSFTECDGTLLLRGTLWLTICDVATSILEWKWMKLVMDVDGICNGFRC